MADWRVCGGWSGAYAEVVSAELPRDAVLEYLRVHPSVRTIVGGPSRTVRVHPHDGGSDLFYTVEIGRDSRSPTVSKVRDQRDPALSGMDRTFAALRRHARTDSLCHAVLQMFGGLEPYGPVDVDNLLAHFVESTVSDRERRRRAFLAGLERWGLPVVVSEQADD